MGGVKVSVIIPIYNCEKYIEECLRSILNQTFQNFEIIIVDDYCSDGSIAVIRKIEDSRIKIFKNDKQKGISNCLNLGISYANGEYIARMDADDICINTRFYEQVVFLDTHKEIGVLGTGFKEFGKSNSIIKEIRGPDEIVIGLLSGAILCHPTIMMRRQLLKGLFYDSKYDFAEDYRLWVEMTMAGIRFYIIDRILLLKRAHNERISTLNREGQILLSEYIRRDHYKYVFNFLNESEIDLICLKGNTTVFDVKRFIFVLSKILQIKKNNTFYKKAVILIIRDTVYRLNPYLNINEFFSLITFRYTFFALNLKDFIRLFKRTFQ